MISNYKKKTFFYILIALGLSAVASFENESLAQVSSKNGWFVADYDRGCVPFSIHLTEVDTFPAQTVKQYDFEGNGFLVGFAPGDPITFTYTSPGIYQLVQVVNQDIITKTDTMRIIVLDSTQPAFKVFTCENNSVTIKISNDQYDRYMIHYTPIDSVEINKGDIVPSFQYPQGSHQVIVRGIIAGGKDNCPATSQNFSTITTLFPASLDRLWLNSKNNVNGAVTLDYSLSPNVVYQLESAVDIPAGFSFREYLSGNQVIIDSLNTLNKIQVFRIAAYDACKDTYIYSDTLATVAIAVTAENAQNKIEWSTFPTGFSEFKLIRDNQFFQSFSNKNINLYIDKGVTCFVNYCYSVASVNSGGQQSISDTVCVNSFSIYFPPAIRNTTTSAATDGYELSWIPPQNISINKFFVQRKIDTDIYSTVDSTSTTTAYDTSVNNTTAPFCYRVSYLDNCNNRSNLGAESCAILLVLEKDNRLSWTPYTGWQNGVKNYVLEIYDETGQLLSEPDIGLQTSYIIGDFYKNQINSYRVRALSNDAPSFIAYSNFVLKTISSVLNVPNAFTPDGDGLNDSFKPVGTGMEQYNIKVYTKNGNLIFISDEQDLGWDGLYNGQEVPEDTYIFDIIAKDFEGKEFRLKGSLTLLRHKL